MAHSELKFFPQNLPKTIMYLDLSHNKIASLSNLPSLNLFFLNLAHNPFKGAELRFLTKYKMLLELDLSGISYGMRDI